jgi:hypothetical protein
VRFLAPLYLVGVVLVALPILLHLFRRDVKPRVPFTAVRLLRGVRVDRSRNRRLRDKILLAARVAALLLLATAFARPYRAGSTRDTPLTIVAVDRSFSMGAPGTFERALAIARSEIDRAARTRVAVIAFDDRAEVLAGPGLAEDARTALTKLSAAGAGGTRYAAMFDRAAELTGDEAGARLIVISDLQRSGFAGAPAEFPKGIDLQPRDAGGTHANVAIDSIDVRGGHVMVSVHNYGSEAAATTLRAGTPSNQSASRSLEVPPGATTAVSFTAPVAEGAIEASLADPDGYPADNARFAIAGPRALPRIVLVTGDIDSSNGFYLSRALLADTDEASAFDVQQVTGQQFGAMQPEAVAQIAAVALLATHGIPRRAAESFKALFDAGGGVFVAAGPETNPAVVSQLLDLDPPLAADDDSQQGALAVRDVRHPVFRAFDTASATFAQVNIDREWRLGSDRAFRTIAVFSSGAPALLERSVRNGRVLLFASDVDRRWNDFPLHATFVPFAQEALRYVAARRPSPTAMSVADVPADTPATPGIISVGGRPRAVNVDTRESTVDRLTPSQFTASVARTDAGPGRVSQRAHVQEAAQSLWWYGLALMLVTLVVEAFVGAR